MRSFRIASSSPRGSRRFTARRFQNVGHELVVHSIEDEANVDRRRAELGLPSLAEYIATAKQMYFPAKEAR
jgi:hypothetical protein